VKSALNYLLTARQCEIAELERLARTSELVNSVGRLVHALQRERGMSNIFLASQGERFGAMRLEQIPQCDALLEEAIAAFSALADDAVQVRNGARLFNRVAIVLDSASGLAQLRGRVAERTIALHDAMAAYIRLIAGLLAVVFEAADSAGDPQISRALVAMFHFMQGKEFAGQERAHGAAVFARGRIDTPVQQHWRHLVEQQHHCFDVFAEFAEHAIAHAERMSHDHGAIVQIERMRRAGQSIGRAPMDESLVDAWYECCTTRLDAMRHVEDLLAHHLKALCERKIGEARESSLVPPSTGMEAPALIGPQLERSVIDMANEHARRLQAVSDELETVRSALNERKLIERAKGVLMANRNITEDEAYRALRQMAMNQKRRIADVAEAVLSIAGTLRA
jgi:hypothetical protein